MGGTWGGGSKMVKCGGYSVIVVAKEAVDLSRESLCYSCGSSYLGGGQGVNGLTHALTNSPEEQHRMDDEYSCKGGERGERERGREEREGERERKRKRRERERRREMYT